MHTPERGLESLHYSQNHDEVIKIIMYMVYKIDYEHSSPPAGRVGRLHENHYIRHYKIFYDKLLLLITVL